MTTQTTLSVAGAIARETFAPESTPLPQASTIAFLIANEGLELGLNHTNERELKIPNRKWMAIFQLNSQLLRFSLTTHHSSLITEFLTCPTAIRTRRKLLKT